MPMRILKDLPRETSLVATKPRTPPENPALDLSLLHSSPPEPVELLKSNKRFNEALRENPQVVSPIRRYTERMTTLCESQNTTIAVLSTQVTEQSKLFQKRKKYKKGKRVVLEGVFLYTTEEVLRIAREAETKPKLKGKRGRPRKVARMEIEDEEKTEDVDSLSDSSDSEEEPHTRYALRSRA